MACCASPHALLYLYRSSSRLSVSSLRLIYPSAAAAAVAVAAAPAPPPRLSSRTLGASPDPPPPLADDRDDAIGFQIQVSSVVGKRNRRLVRARVRVDAPLEAVWATLTDYEGLADFIPGLSECRLLDQAHGFARIYQVGLAAYLTLLRFHSISIRKKL